MSFRRLNNDLLAAPPPTPGFLPVVLGCLPAPSSTDARKAFADKVCEAITRCGGSVLFRGQRDFVVLQSAQFDHHDWDVLVIGKFNERVGIEALTSSQGFRDAMGHCTKHFVIGMESLPKPIVLFHRARSVFKCLRPCLRPRLHDSGGDFAKIADFLTHMRGKMNQGGGDDQLFMLNLIKRSTDKADVKANDKYERAMVRMFASHDSPAGPWVIGRALDLGGGAQFELVALVCYPSRQWMYKLLRSKWMQSVGKGKRLGDTECVLVSAL